MAIVGLTTYRTPRPSRIGVLRKGAPKPEKGNRPGADLEHFRLDADDDVVAAFEAAYPEQNDIEVYLPYPSAEENFEAWREEWTASELKHRCDGERVYTRDNLGNLVPTNRKCPGGCKQVGRLTVIIPALITGAHRFGLVTVVTTSIWDIVSISEALAYYEMFAGGDLRGIPFILSRRPREISTPSGQNGGRARRTKWLITIQPSPKYVQNRLEAAKQAALGGAQIERPLLVDSRTGEIVDDDDDDVIDPNVLPRVRVDGKPVAEPAPKTNGHAKPTIDDIRARYTILTGYAEKLSVKFEPVPNDAGIKELVEAGKALKAAIEHQIEGIVAEARELRIPVAEIPDDFDARMDAAIDLLILIENAEMAEEAESDEPVPANEPF